MRHKWEGLYIVWALFMEIYSYIVVYGLYRPGLYGDKLQIPIR